jgi:ribose-phosphate pyrophosphokinase
MGVDRIIACDLHCGQIQGFFGPNVPVDNLECSITALKHFANEHLENPVIVSPDAGGVYRAKKFQGFYASEFTPPGLAMIIKQRFEAGSVGRMDLVGQVEGCDVIIVDDMIDTAGTLCTAAAELKRHGANKVYAFATHGLFSSNAIERIHASVLEQVIVTNTIPLPHAETNSSLKSSGSEFTSPKVKQISVGLLLAEAIRRSYQRESLNTLFYPKSFRA